MDYMDSSALVKRYVEEPGSEAVRSMLRMQGRAATSRVTFAEVAAAVARRCREGDISVRGRNRIFARMEVDFQRILVVEVTAELVETVPDLVREHPLRGFDAVHLASCLLLGKGGGGTGRVRFVCTDPTLLRAAAALGLKVMNPSA